MISRGAEGEGRRAADFEVWNFTDEVFFWAIRCNPSSRLAIVTSN